MIMIFISTKKVIDQTIKACIRIFAPYQPRKIPTTINRRVVQIPISELRWSDSRIWRGRTLANIFLREEGDLSYNPVVSCSMIFTIKELP